MEREKNKAHFPIVKKLRDVAVSYTIHEFNRLYDDLKTRYLKAIEYLENNVVVEKWAICYFSGSQYNILTTDGAKCINGVLRKARMYPLVPLIDAVVENIF